MLYLLFILVCNLTFLGSNMFHSVAAVCEVSLINALHSTSHEFFLSFEHLLIYFCQAVHVLQLSNDRKLQLFLLN